MKPSAAAHQRATLYAALHRGNPGDVAFYQAQTAGAHRILELGCGAGRLLSALAAPGAEVWGLELDLGLAGLAEASVARLPAATRARIHLQHGDMRAFALDRRFDRILLPYNGLYCLTSAAAQRACLQCVAAHLTPAGLLLLDGYNADDFHQHAEPGPDPWQQVAEIRWRGQPLAVFERSDWQPAQQQLVAHYRYVDATGRLVHEDRIPQRYLRTAELSALFASAELQLRTLWGDFA
ncbi:MAG: class I SAM-dependent methyltransferase, partial [Polyangiales bacterium]